MHQLTSELGQKSSYSSLTQKRSFSEKNRFIIIYHISDIEEMFIYCISDVFLYHITYLFHITVMLNNSFTISVHIIYHFPSLYHISDVFYLLPSFHSLHGQRVGTHDVGQGVHLARG